MLTVDKLDEPIERTRLCISREEDIGQNEPNNVLVEGILPHWCRRQDADEDEEAGEGSDGTYPASTRSI